MRDGRYVLYGSNQDTRALERADSRFASGTGPAHEHLYLSNAVFHSLAGGVFAGALRHESGGLSGSSESDRA